MIPTTTQALTHKSESSPGTPRTLRLCLSIAALSVTLLGAGCEVDSYIDPSIVGRWEHTPTVTPILERLSAIEDLGDGFVEYSEVSAEDLIPEAAAYRIGPGDLLEVTIEGFVSQGVREQYALRVNAQGGIEIPQLPIIQVSGLTSAQASERISLAIAQADINRNSLVQINVAEQRQLAYNVFGSVSAPGPYILAEPDFRLLQALTTAGGFNESAKYIYVIRQVPLSAPESSPSLNPAQAPVVPTNPDGQQPGDPSFLDLIDDLTGVEGAPPTPTTMASRGTMRRSDPSSPPINLMPQDAPDPIVDLVDARSRPVASQATAPLDTPTRWVFLDGQWVQIANSTGDGPDDAMGDEALVTQRVIRVPTEPLVNGDARYNIVIRPGDLIRVPVPPTGNVYLAGQVNRPGVYALPAQGSFTLTRAITAAGGYGPTAIPERVDITRMVGTERQATMRLNARAIAEGTQPDVMLKPDDHINVGTNFWALPLAVVRNGMRASYGFGFLIDRNFGNDVFGAPPSNNNR